MPTGLRKVKPLSISLPIHPVTGLTALGIGKRGPIWPVLGASEDAEDTTPDEGGAPQEPELPEVPEPEQEPETPKPGKPEAPAWTPPASQDELDKMIARRLARENSKHSDALAKAAKYDELEAAKKSNEERLADELTSIRKENDGLKLDKLRAEIVAAKGLPPKLAKRLTGSTREEMEADAEELLEDMPKAEPKVALSQKPKENLRGGGRPDEEPEETDPRKLAARIPRR